MFFHWTSFVRTSVVAAIGGLGLATMLLPPDAGAAEERRGYPALFEAAGREFGVPADILKGIAFAETRWTHLAWAPGDIAACNGMPRPYGIMSLWDNDHFGRSLHDAAAWLGENESVLKADVRQNIRGAAALLRRLRDARPGPEGTGDGDLESWRDAIAAYCGIPQPELAQQHALDVYAFIHRGYHHHGIEWPGRPVNLDAVRAAVRRVQAAVREGRDRRAPGPGEGRRLRDETTATAPSGGLDPAPLFQPAGQPDYPGAVWRPAYPGHWYTSGNGRHFVVIHDMEGYYLSTISYFQRSNTQASAHYCINGLKDNAADSPAGEITQMVEEKYYAWHARCLNTWSLGIEHEGFVNNPAWYTEEQYQASAGLTRYLCDKYGIPMDRNHIIAHGEWQSVTWRSWMSTNYPAIDAGCNTHTDPGANWAWEHYLQLVIGLASPAITVPPVSQVRDPGATAQFNVAATGTGPLQFQWRKDGAVLPGATNLGLTLTNVQLLSAGDYSVVVRNAGGSVTSAVATLNVTAPAAPLGTGTGLLGGYFDREDFTGARFSRVDSTVNFGWGLAGPASFMGDDTFAVRWVGWIEPRYSQRYSFHVRADDAVRLWVDGQLLLDEWAASAPGEWTGRVDLSAGRRSAIRLDFVERAGSALAELRWSSASQVKQVVPRTQLYPPALGLEGSAVKFVEAGTRVRLRVAGFDPDPTAGSVLWREDFESYPAGTADGSVLFRAPSYSGSTALFLDGPGGASVTNGLPGGASPDRGARALRVTWGFAPDAVSPWLRLTTAAAAQLPNPAVDPRQVVQFDVWSDRPLRVGLGLRETTNTVWPGDDAGVIGPIEFVGVGEVLSGVPQPVRLVMASNWTTLRFDLPAEAVQPFTGDGVLNPSLSACALEHLALVPGSSDASGPHVVYLDNLTVAKANTLSYALVAGPPGATMDERTGELDWTPAPADMTGTNWLTVRIQNRSTPPLVLETNLAVVIRPPVRPQLRLVDGFVELAWETLPGASYRVQVAESVTEPGAAWHDLTGTMVATETRLLIRDSLPARGGARFYRVLPGDVGSGP